MVDFPDLDPRNSDLRGGLIGLTGTELRLSCERIDFRPRADLIETTHPSYTDFSGSGSADVAAADFATFIGGGQVRAGLAFSGTYIGPDTAGVVHGMEEGAAVAVTVHLDEGIDYAGDFAILESRIVTVREGEAVTIAVTGVFSGRITGEGTGSARAQAVTLDVKPGTSMSKSAQASRDDSAMRSFVATGFDNANTSLEQAIDVVIGKAGGIDSTYPRPSGYAGPPLYLLGGSGQWRGRDTLVGVLRYGRGPLSVCNDGIKVDTGWVVEKGRNPAEVGSGSNTEACDALSGSGYAFTASIRAYVKKRVPYKIYTIPCVWDAEPNDDDYQGRVNANASYTIGSRTFGANVIRWDNVVYQEIKRPDGTTKYSGAIRLSVKPDGWEEKRIHCITTVPVSPQPANAVATHYTTIHGWRTYLRYNSATFPTLAAFCPNCYG